MNNNWQNIAEKYQNSVFQIRVTRAKYDPLRPYRPPVDEEVLGTGFVIFDNKIVTNAHVVSNAISIRGRITKFGKRDISLKLISICREKDLAICEIDEKLESIQPKSHSSNFAGASSEIQPLPLGDNFTLKKADRVITLGYPLGDEDLKITTGDISGFPTVLIEDPEVDDQTEDSYAREPAYIQITAPINPGNSGGPLLNEKGEVVGINAAGELFAQNIAYAIGIRTLLAIYSDILSPKFKPKNIISDVLYVPTFSLLWNRMNPEMIKLLCDKKNITGIYVRKVYPDSCFNFDERQILKKGDVITQLSYGDNPYSNKDKCYDNKSKTYNIDNFGDLHDIESDEIKSLSQIVDVIPTDSEITLEICRNGKFLSKTTNFSVVWSNRITKIYPTITPYVYEIFAGICVVDLTLNLVKYLELEDLFLEIKGDKLYEPKVIIVQIFPETLANSTKSLKVGDVISEVNQNPIRTVIDVKQILKSKPKYIEITTNSDKLFIIPFSLHLVELKEIFERFDI